MKLTIFMKLWFSYSGNITRIRFVFGLVSLIFSFALLILALGSLHALARTGSVTIENLSELFLLKTLLSHPIGWVMLASKCFLIYPFGALIMKRSEDAFGSPLLFWLPMGLVLMSRFLNIDFYVEYILGALLGVLVFAPSRTPNDTGLEIGEMVYAPRDVSDIVGTVNPLASFGRRGAQS